MAANSAPPRRFEIALSFPGEHRDFVKEVAAHLASTFSEERILYDHYHDAEFARLDLDVYLPALYNEDGTPRSAKDDLADARRLIEKHGYWRRKEELEDAERAIGK